MSEIYANLISAELGISRRQAENVISLLEEGATIPFISRYRKEATGNLDEVMISAIDDKLSKLKEISKRKETILSTISSLGKLTEDLKKRIDDCWDSTILEDIYLPYKPKRRTKAMVAREKGLEPLAITIFRQSGVSPDSLAKKFVKGEVKSVEEALAGAMDIIAETVSEDEKARQIVRMSFSHKSIIRSKVVKGKETADEAQKYSDYFDFSEPLARCSSHRLLAMRRGEAEGILKVSIGLNDDSLCVDKLNRKFVRSTREDGDLVAQAVEDSYKRLIRPSIETEFSSLSKEKADEEAIRVFVSNLRQLLLAAPLGQKRVMGIDPGFRTGCKVVCLDSQGNLLHHEAIFPHPPVSKRYEAAASLENLAAKYRIEGVAIGNGTAGRETFDFVKTLHLPEGIRLFSVSEDGASVYSASEIAREEFPDKDVTVRGAISIGRRLIDPLAELVKIDPKSIGVGQYQHDVDQKKLRNSLTQTVESCVNTVGVNLNTASVHLLTYISGLGPVLAKNIVDYRREHGDFQSRSQLLKVPRLGKVAYQQCAGFLRIPGAKNPLDNSAVHPESYHIVEKMAKDCKCSVADLISSGELRGKIDLKKYVGGEVGMPTLTDIMKELEKPGRDPRQQAEEFEFDPNVHTPEDLKPGMVLPGIVTNITNFGAFVDIGVHQDGLVHISQMARKYVSDPNTVVHLRQQVLVKVLDIDLPRKRISLTLNID